ncbi:hypothetical protein AB0H82_35545 [Streptomyces sp. NPDC050732]|uniref:hypothetical protein n=1 Tax=Streptomyces sp. NPDC050732 TaxID=3154632 RepID=UPI003432102D
MARTRSRTGHGQWLLLVALLFGIVTMHTLGHPSGGSGGGHGGARHGGDRQVAGESLAGAAGAAGAPDGLGEGRGRMGGTVGEHRADAGHGDPMNPGRHGDLMNPEMNPEMDPGRHGDRDMGVAVSAAGPASGSHDGGMAMDPLSVCLAVLGAFTLAVLVRAGLLRRGPGIARSRAPGRLLHVLRPNPPPPRILLSRLSVLRI